MSTPPDRTPADSLPDPASLLDHPGVDVETTEELVDAEDFAAAAESWTDHVAVGVADDRGVLCYDDGHHGWTLPAFEIPDDAADVLAVARREFEALTGVPVTVDGVEHARRRTFTVAEEDEADDRETDVWNVVLGATPTAPLADDPESRVEGADLAWRDAAPEDAPDVVAADIERIADRRATDTATPVDPTDSLADPETLRDRDGVEHVTVSDDDHFESNQRTEGAAVVGVTNADGDLALPTFESGTVLTHALVEDGGDFADTARSAAADLLGVDVALDDVLRVRRKVSAPPDADEAAVAHVVVYAASPAGDAELPEDPPSCQVESTDWYDAVPDDLVSAEMREDLRLFVD